MKEKNNLILKSFIKNFKILILKHVLKSVISQTIWMMF